MAKRKTKPPKEKAVEAALKLAEEKGWEAVSLQDVAVKAKIPLADLYDLFEDRVDILTAWGRMIDRRMIEACGAPDPETQPRDRLLDLLMERIEIVNEQRDAVRSILRSFRCDPKQAVIGLPHLARSMSWTLEAAGIPTGGPGGAFRVAALTGIYLKTLWTWRTDDTPDLSATMAALDRNLSFIDRF